IFDWFRDAAKTHHYVWQYDNETVLLGDELKPSLEKSGTYPLFVGVHCLENGLKMPEDVHLRPVEVEVDLEKDQIRWRLGIICPDDDAELRFTFDRRQMSEAYHSGHGDLR